MLLSQSLPITVLWKGHSWLRYYISQSSGMSESLDYSYPQWAVEFFHFLLLPWSEKGSIMLLDNSDFLICWNSISLSARCTLISPSFSFSWNKLYIGQVFRYLKICYPFSHSHHHQLFSEWNVSGSLSCSSHGMFLRFSIVPETWSLCSVFLLSLQNRKWYLIFNYHRIYKENIFIENGPKISAFTHSTENV